MNYRTTSVWMAVLGVFGLTAGGWAAEGLRNMTSDKITVSYPAELEPQAKQVMAIAKEAIGPSLDVNRQIVDVLANADSIAKDISNLLGCQDKHDNARARLIAYRQKSEALVACFSNIRLIKKGEAAATGGVDAGILQVRYIQDKDEFTMTISLEDTGPDKIKFSYFPVFVNADGSIRAEKKLGEMAVDFLGSSRTMIIAPIHDTVGYTITQELNLYHPFSRWFNEGVAGWITRQVVAKTDPKLASIANDLFAVSPKSKQLRDKINFLCWPQASFQNRRAADFDPALESSHVQHAIEATADMLGKNPVQTLPKIMQEVNFNVNADTETILAAIKKATGRDFKPTFMTYVPQSIRDGIKAGDAKKLVAHAEQLVAEKKWSDAVAKLGLALRMEPGDVNTRLNLAWVEREIGERLDSEIQVFLAARLLDQGNHSFHLIGESLEGNYVLGRFAILMGNLEYAKKFLQPVLAANPDHPDAKRAMDEIKKIEAAAGVGAAN